MFPNSQDHPIVKLRSYSSLVRKLIDVTLAIPIDKPAEARRASPDIDAPSSQEPSSGTHARAGLRDPGSPTHPGSDGAADYWACL